MRNDESNMEICSQLNTTSLISLLKEGLLHHILRLTLMIYRVLFHINIYKIKTYT